MIVERKAFKLAQFISLIARWGLLCAFLRGKQASAKDRIVLGPTRHGGVDDIVVYISDTRLRAA